MKTSPFKVMTTAALATALAVPAVATTADAAEVEMKQIAFELDGEVQVVDFNDYVNAIVSESGDLYDYVTEASPEAIGISEGSFVSYEALVNAIIDDEEGKTGQEVLAEVSTNAEAQVSEDTVAEYKTFGEEEVTELVVDSVTADNLKNVTVDFNTAVDSESLDVEGTDATVKVYKNGAETTTTLDGSNLSEDGKTLSLALPSLNQSDEVTVSIDGLEAADMNYTLSDFEETVTATDVNAPVAKSVEVLNNKTINLHFSEPVDLDTDGVFETTSIAKTGASMKVDGDLVYAKFTPYPAQNYVEVEFFNSLDDGNHTLDLSEVNDFAGFEAEEETFNFNTETDETAPVATDVTYVGKNTVDVTFSEKVDINGSSFAVYQAGDNTNLFNTSSVKKDGKTVRLSLNPGFDVAATVGFDVQYKNVEDVFGNEISEYKTISGEATDDDTKPSVKSVEVVSGNDLEVAFDEPVNVTNNNFNLYKSDGETLVASNATSITDSNNDKTTFTVGFSALSNVNGGNYQLEVEDVQDTSIRGNTIDTEQYSVTVTDSVRPELLNAVVSTDVDGDEENDQIELVFDEPMDLDKLEDIKNYFVGTGGSADTALSTISGAQVLSVDANGTRVTLQVPVDNSQGGNDLDATYTDIAAPTLTDDSDNLLTNAKISNPVTLSSTFPVFDESSFKSVVAPTTNKAVITLDSASKHIFSDVDVDDFMFKVGGNQVDLGLTSAQLSQDGQSVSLTFSKSLNADGTFSGTDVNGNTVSGSVAVDIASTNVGTVDQNNQTLTIDHTASEASVTDEINPAYDSLTRGASSSNVTDIDLKFTEAVTSNKDDIVASNFEVYDAQGNKLTNLLTSGTPSEGEYALSGVSGDDTVTISVYGQDEDTYEVNFTGSEYLEDTSNNQAEDFSVTVDVYGSN